MTSRLIVSVVLVGTLIGAPAVAQQLIVYPAKGQSAQQQRKDEGECYVWARDRTGIDPTAGTSAPPPQQQPTGAVARGAARGAVGGAIIGEVSGGSAGTGAAAGAVLGGVKGAARQQRSQQQAAQQAQASAMQQFQRAYGACLEGRGYTVK
jgi:hypothetical protein